jgi:hypothetical protein
MVKLLGAAVLGLVLSFAEVASAQVFYEAYSPVYAAPVAVQSYYAPRAMPVQQAYTSTTAYYAPPQQAYYAQQQVQAAYCPTTTYSPVVQQAYSPVYQTSYAAPVAAMPVTTYYAPTVAYSPVVTYAPAPVVYARPLYVPGQPVRNYYRRLWW